MLHRLFADVHAAQVVSTVTYSILGIAVFFGAYALIEKICPFSVKKEISQDHNVALGIVIGCVILGLSLIVSAAIVTD